MGTHNFFSERNTQPKTLTIMKVSVALILALVGICSAVPTCQNKKGQQFAGLLVKNVQPKGFACTTCKYLVDELETYLIGDHSEQEAIDYLKSYCDSLEDFLPGWGLGDECKSLVDSYIKDFLDGLLANLTPEEICKDVSLC